MIAFYLAGIVDELDLLTGDRRAALRFEAQDGQTFQLPVSKRQLEAVLAETVGTANPRPAPPPPRSPTRASRKDLEQRGHVDVEPGDPDIEFDDEDDDEPIVLRPPIMDVGFVDSEDSPL